jgi:hypothetical protein
MDGLAIRWMNWFGVTSAKAFTNSQTGQIKGERSQNAKNVCVWRTP